VNRRQFSQTLTLGAIAAAPALGAPALSPRKEWARENLKGMGNVIMPSFSPDFKKLDEDAIRLDVKQSIKHGFTACVISPVGADAARRRRMMEIVSDEARGKLETGIIAGGSAESAIQSLAEAARMGCSHALLTYPATANPNSEDEVYAHFRKIIDSARMAILLYGSPVESLKRFHPSGIPLNVYDRLADDSKVVGMKLTHPMSTATAFEICERLSDRLIMAPVNLELLPVLAKNYKNVQWSGQWIVEAVQSPEKPYAVELMDLAIKRQIEGAMKVYWQMQPLIQAIYNLQAPLLLHGSHPWAHMKYHQWCTGGNGGLLPLKPGPYLPQLDAPARKLIRDTYTNAGITPAAGPEEEFMVGRSAYQRGVRPAALSETPLYSRDAVGRA